MKTGKNNHNGGHGPSMAMCPWPFVPHAIVALVLLVGISCASSEGGADDPGDDDAPECGPVLPCDPGYVCLQGYCVPNPEPPPEYDCPEIWQCMLDCLDDEEELECYHACLESGSQESYDQAMDLLICMEQAPCEDSETSCFHDHCSREVDACFPRITGDDTCREMVQCFHVCPGGETECSDLCYYSATADAQDQYHHIWSCYQRECGDPADELDEACMRRLCRDEIDHCFFPGYGILMCSQIYQCKLDCVYNDDGNWHCFDACYLDGSQEGRLLINRLFACFDDSGCDHDDSQCLTDNCTMEIIDCGLM